MSVAALLSVAWKNVGIYSAIVVGCLAIFMVGVGTTSTPSNNSNWDDWDSDSFDDDD